MQTVTACSAASKRRHTVYHLAGMRMVHTWAPPLARSGCRHGGGEAGGERRRPHHIAQHGLEKREP